MRTLIPAWIIGVPLILAIVDWMRTPKAGPSTHAAARPVTPAR